ncbi:MAG: DegT/DnrJ/EryC1/StrS family aminotransferase, partial [Oscillospiraceae bacterium]
MEFRNLKEQYRVLKNDIDKGIMEVCAKGDFISGTQVAALEKELCRFVGTSHCVSCGNGTDALVLALGVLG